MTKDEIVFVFRFTDGNEVELTEPMVRTIECGKRECIDTVEAAPGSALCVALMKSPKCAPHAGRLSISSRRGLSFLCLLWPWALLRFPHPDGPCQRADLLVLERPPRHLQRQLDLPVVVPLVPDQMLQHQQWMIVVVQHLAV